MELNRRAEKLIVEENICRGVIDSDGRREEADFVLIATGGLSYASTGSTGDGYHMAEEAGHTLAMPRPSLVPMETEEGLVPGIDGLIPSKCICRFKKR